MKHADFVNKEGNPFNQSHFKWYEIEVVQTCEKSSEAEVVIKDITKVIN
jgi:hypothetical protein